MGRIRTTVATALDGVIGGLASVRDAIAASDGDSDGATDRPTGGSEREDRVLGASRGVAGGSPAGDPAGATSGDPPDPSDRGSADGDDSRASGVGGSDDPNGRNEATDLEPADATTDLETADDDGLTGAVREWIGTDYEYQTTVLRHPIAAQRAHLSALRETPVLSTDFVKQAFVATESVKRDRVEQINDQLEDDRTLRDDARDLAATVDWSRTWEYGKYGFLVGSRYRKRMPVGDAYAPVAGAVAGGAVGAVASATDRTLVDVDPDRLFDRIDAVSRLRDDPVTRAQVTRETLRAVDRRVGNDDLPVERLFEDDLFADLVTREDEAVPESVPGSSRTRAAITELIWGDPLSGPPVTTDTPSLPPGRPDRSADGPPEDAIDAADPTDGEPPSDGDRDRDGEPRTGSDENRDRSEGSRHYS